MSRLQQLASKAREEGRKLLTPYLVAGDPNLASTAQLLDELVAQGADIIELGIPFSDPASDGPVIQQGVERALAKKVTLANTLELVRQFRARNQDTAIVLMGYLNPIEIMGYEVFAEAARDAGVDGVLVVDMPPAESSGLHEALRSRELDTIYLVAPTTGEARSRDIIQHCSGYLYYVSLKGVTGAALTDHDSVAASIGRLRTHTDLPIVIGFGIKDGASAAAMAALADGVIIGSALVNEIGKLADTEQQDGDSLRQSCAVIGAARKAIDKLK
jgi:tryptophan synthase alpha chain